jgi:hypothetical protein
METRLASLEMPPKAVSELTAPVEAAATAAPVRGQHEAHDVGALLLPAAPPPPTTEVPKVENQLKPDTPPAVAAEIPLPTVAPDISTENAADKAAARDSEVAKLVTEIAEERTKRMQMEARLAALEAALDINGSEWEATIEVANEIKAHKKAPVAASVVASSHKVALKRPAFGNKHMEGLFPPRPGAR